MPSSLWNRLDSTSEDSSDLEELQAAAVDFYRLHRDFHTAVLHLPEHAPVERVEMAAARLLRQTVTVAQNLRRSLSTLKVYFALLWARVDRFDDGEEPNDDEDLVAWALETSIKQLETLQQDADHSIDGHSHDGRVTATIGGGMQLIELDVDPFLLSDPEYQAAVIDAVNARFGPVVRQRSGMMDALLAGPESYEQAPAANVDDADDPIFCVLDALCLVEEAQRQLAMLLSGISRGEEFPALAAEIEETQEHCQEAEGLLRNHLPSLRGYRYLLHTKARLPNIKTDDLTEVESLERLFLEENDDICALESAHGVEVSGEVRELIEAVASVLQRQDEERELRRFWQVALQRQRSQVARVEQQTFEATSGDGSITARVNGSAQLVELKLDFDDQIEPARIKAAVIEAINAAIDTARHQRCLASMIEPSG